MQYRKKVIQQRQCEAVEYVLLGCTTYLYTIALKTAFPDGCRLFQQDIALCHSAKIVQECFEGHELKVLPWSPKTVLDRWFYLL